MAVRVSQEVAEAEVIGASARVSQVVVEAEVIAGSARTSQVVVEAEVTAGSARASQLALEAAIIAGHARASQLVVECLIVNIGVFMPLVYPDLPGLSYPIGWNIQFFNLPTQVTASGANLDLGLAQYPLHDFDLPYEFLVNDLGKVDFRMAIGFFGAMSGNLGRFLFTHPDDHSIKSQVIGTTDGVAHVWPLVRTFGVGEASWTEPVGYVDVTAPFNVYLDGVIQDPSSYAVLTTEPVNQQLDFTSGTPSAGKVITVDMDYYYFCKFADPNMTYNKFMKQLWDVRSVKIKSCRPGA